MSLKGAVVYKMSGSGNDFVFADGRTDPVSSWSADAIRGLCARRTGIGADGFVVLEPGSEPGAVRFHFFNNDGGRASMCGNAALCATRLAAWLELAPADGMRLHTDAGVIATRCLPGPGERAELSLGAGPEVSTPGIDLGAGERDVRFAVVGVPHLVLLVDDPAAVDVVDRGRVLRSHAALGADGANVNFVGPADNGWAMRTYERGVENETLACGTGAVATAAALLSLGQVSLPWDVRTSSGSILTISGTSGTGANLADVRLAGEGRQMFRAVIEQEFA